MARLPKQGESVWNQTEKINAELFAFTYGSLVVKLIRELESLSKVNEALEQMGYNIGVRLIDDFLSKNEVSCEEVKDIADAIAKIAFKVYLGITCEVTNWSEDNKEFSLIMTENPMIDYVELREDFRELSYCNLLCGVIRGALHMLKYETKVYIVRDALKGEDATEIRCVISGRKTDEYDQEEEKLETTI
jgi:trafficking protein particle complex subunit 3